jgi:hypothetical protein
LRRVSATAVTAVTAVTAALEEGLDGVWSDERPLRLLEGVAAKNARGGVGRWLFSRLEQVDDRAAGGVHQSEGLLEARYGDLLDVGRELDAWPIADLHHLVDAAERGLRLARDEMRADDEGIDLEVRNVTVM